MEDEDVDCVTKISVPIVENCKTDGLHDACNDENITEPTEKVITPNEDNGEHIDRLKCAINLDVDRFKEDESSNVESPVPSPKKVNGEVDKSESVVSSEELCDKSEDVEEDLKSEKNKEDGSDSGKEEGSDLIDTNKRKRSTSDNSNVSNNSDNESNGDSASDSTPVEFRAFKKRKVSTKEEDVSLDVCETIPNEVADVVSSEPEKPKLVELRRSARNASIAKKQLREMVPQETKEESGDQLTEYAQYLGLQPTVKFKCGRCGEKHFQSMASLNDHQMVCCKTSSSTLAKQTKPSNDSSLSTNFRITRKVYLCSACGTYYENWKLFLHMRDMHRRHICLFCLGMFSVAERLAEHLLYQHNVHEKTCKSPEEFLNLFKGSCYLTCCTCEKMFTERDDFYDHQCKEPVPTNPCGRNENVSLTPKDIKELAQKCNLCRVKCGHFRMCPKVAHKFKQSSLPSPSTGTIPPNNMSVEKYYVPVPTNVQKHWNPNNVDQNMKHSLSLAHTEKDYYDVSGAASFCHVDLANDTDNQSSPGKSAVEKSNIDSKKCHKPNSKSSLQSDDIIEINTEEDDEEEEQIDSSKVDSNNVVHSISDDSNISDRLESKNIEPNSKSNEDNNKVIEADDVRLPVDDSATPKQDKSLERLDGTSVQDDVSKTQDKEDDDDDDKTRENVDNMLPCFVKLDKMDVPDCLDSRDDNEENSQHDSTVSSSSSNSNHGMQNTDLDGFVPNESATEPKKAEDGDKPETVSNDQDKCFDNVSDDSTDANRDNFVANKSDSEKTVVKPANNECADNTFDDSSLNNEERLSSLSNEESCDRFEDNDETLDKSDGANSEDSDKLSVDLDEDEEKEVDDEDSNCKNSLAIGETIDGANDKVETDERLEDCGGSEGETTTGLGEMNAEEDAAMEESHPAKETCFQCDGVSIQLANDEVMAMALTLEDKMDSLSSQSVIKECVRTSCTTCSYCSHAIKIGVNGKQLAIHLLTEHRYMPVKNETVDDIIERLKKSLDELKDVWFNTDSYDSSDKTCFVPYDHTYECFQCNYVANTHKDLFSHKRKVHQKTILYCSMCKENFYSYSELLCHMCPGLYDAAKDIKFRCCLCTTHRIPSAFRLMVHLRKSHHACDICLEIVDDQQKLSAHMVKHKLHHLCYRCGIAYRNKPDITKHLFWKHGTESVLCKKCLQKKWPHVYHFCIPPNAFLCEECNLSFSKAVYLKVHKRFHNNNLPHGCNTCELKFVSKKLLDKHEKIHEPVAAEENVNSNNTSLDTEKGVEENNVDATDVLPNANEESAGVVQHNESSEKTDDTSVKPHKKKSKRDKEKKIKPVVDVYDLPPLNLSSESDDTEDEKEIRPTTISTENKEADSSKVDDPIEATTNDVEEKPVGVDSDAKTADPSESAVDNEEVAPPVTVVDGIWDNFHTYKAEQEKRENLDIANKQSILSQLEPTTPPVLQKDEVLGDHDYCLPDSDGVKCDDVDVDAKAKSNEHSSSIDHDYCTQKNDSKENGNIGTPVDQLNVSNQSESTETPPKKKQKSPKKKGMKQHNNSSSSSDSSSDSDSSSCSCGTNCSCSSSSSNSSSSSSSDSDSSSSDGRNNSSNMSKREKKKERLKNKKKGEIIKPVEPLPPVEEPPVNIHVEPEEPLIRESELDTDETATDEEFYDQYPQMQANQILAEKRNQLMLLATVAPTANNGTASPPVPNSTNINLDPVSSPRLEIVTPPVTPVQSQSQSKKKVKTKKRRKSSTLSSSRNRTNKQPSLNYETPQPSTSFTPHWQPSGHGKKVTNDVSPMYTQSPVQSAVTAVALSIKMNDPVLPSTPITSQHPHHSTSSSESSSKRFSKRRRVRNKFYGYSSDEDGEHHPDQPPMKLKKFPLVDGNTKQNAQQQFYPQSFQQPTNVVHPEYNHGYQHHVSPLPVTPKSVPPMIRTTFDEHQVNNSVSKRPLSTPVSSESSSDSDADSDSDSNRLAISQQNNATSITIAGLNSGASEKDDKLYCYCQCPYDEVSEMIACDGIDCAIEWFHFECVGIMVPPKGKWYCPDCRKRRGLS